MVADVPDLRAIFSPRSVAVYGASTRDPSKLGNRLLRNVVASAVDDVVAVSPTPGTAEGLPTKPSLANAVDLALISVPAASVEAAVADAAAGGARSAVVLTSGFGETGPAGKAAQERIRAIAAGAGMRFLGPNCMGVISSQSGGGWLNGSYFWDVDLTPGGVTMLSQSGAFGGMFLAEMSRRGLGVCRFASLGNCADLDETQILRWLDQDPATEVVGLFAEALSGGRDFVRAVRSLSADRPVVVLKAGTTSTGARAALSHTGSIAGSHGAVSAALRRAGAIEAEGADEFFDLLSLAASPVPRPASVRMAIVTVSGGPSVLAADEAERLGLALPELAPSTLQAMRAVIPPFAATRNPVDLTPQCPASAYGPAVDALYDDPRVDGVVVIDCGLDVEPFGDAVVAAQRRTCKPTVGFLSDVPTVRQSLEAAGIPLFPSPERAVRAYRSLWPSATPRVPRDSHVSGPGIEEDTVKHSDPASPPDLRALSEWESKQRLRALPLVPERRTTSLNDAAIAVAELRVPLVAKASGVAHKSDRGLVRLRLTPREVLEAWPELAGAGDGSVLVAEYIAGELELVVGGTRDPHLGPAVTVGLGGVATEAFGDTVTVLAPPEPGEVRSALSRLRGAALLQGYRGSTPVDLTALTTIVEAVSALLTEDGDVMEIDCNPVIITNGKPTVVDALVVVRNRT